MDMLTFDSSPNVAHLQQDDILNLGQLMLTLACKSLTATHNIPKSIDYIAQQYSQDLKNIILFLMSQPVPMKTVDQIITMLGARVLQEVNDVQNANDVLESDLGRELENGRLARLLMKFGFINERPEFDMDPAWSETGDRYIIKLFRDYVFHQVDETGLPVLDVAHVLTCLNKVMKEWTTGLLLLLLLSNCCLSFVGVQLTLLPSRILPICSWMPEWTKRLCSCQETSYRA
jgi:PAB-dependent poly(A)-specific ribonuclease subunit 3